MINDGVWTLRGTEDIPRGENIDKVRHLTVLGYPEGNPGAQIGGADYFHKIYPRRNVVGINRIADDEAGENPVIF